MRKKLQKVFAMLLAISMVMSLMSVTVFADEPAGDPAPSAPAIVSDEQITNLGGEKTDDHVKVSKTIEGTEYENVFDITLTVETETDLQEIVTQAQATDIVFVMDISNTMKEKMQSTASGTSDDQRYLAAKAATAAFFQKLGEQTDGVTRRVGFVAFNTSAHEIAGLAAPTTTLLNTITEKTDNIIYNYRSSDPERYTNIEAGLKMAHDMLKPSVAPNKVVILLSDGFPTTYIKSGYNGYYPDNNKNYAGITADNVFYDNYYNCQCNYGTSYSDMGAYRAQEEASKIRNDGIMVYSVGVGLGGQQVLDFYYSGGEHRVIDESTNELLLDPVSVVDCFESEDDPNTEANERDERLPAGKRFMIGEDTEAYKQWLGNQIASGYDGYYYDSTNQAELINHFSQILESIKEDVKTSASASWVASDPMNASGAANIDFMQFYDMNGVLVDGDLEGSWTEGDEDTAYFAGDKISWDMKNSGFTKVVDGNKTTYIYNLKYRVRLTNEVSGFSESKDVQTNGTTTLKYQITTSSGGTTSQLQDKEIDFKVPSVKGYLGEFLFRKVDSKTGDPIKNTEFTLTHNHNCPVCSLEGADSDFTPFVEVSDANGIVKFDKIPSGHTYTLVETTPNDGYAADSTEYAVVIDFNKTTVDGKAVVTNEEELFKTVTETPEEGDPVETTVAKVAEDFVDGEGNIVETFFMVENTPKAKLTITKTVEGRADFETAFETGYFKFAVKATKNDVEVYNETVALPLADGSWSVTLDKLPDGTYSVREIGTEDYNNGFLANGYTWTGVAYDGQDTMTPLALMAGDEGAVTVTNTYTYTPDNESIKVVKKWDDDSNRDGIRPDGVIFQLVVGDQVVGIPSELVIYTDNTKNSFDGGFSYNPRLGIPAVREIGYVIINDEGVEEKVYGEIPEYTADISLSRKTPGNSIPTITNKYEPEVVKINVEKVWDESTDGRTLPEKITVVLKADGKEVNRAEITPRVVETTTLPVEEGGEPIVTTETLWDPVTFTTDKNNDPLYKYDDGAEIEYTVVELINGQEVKEDASRGWRVEYDMTEWEESGEGAFDWEKDATITNSYISGGGGGGSTTISCKVVKVWNDDDNASEARPESITVQLLGDGVPYGDAVVLSGTDDWTYTWTALDKAVEWSVAEVDVPEGYTSEVKKTGNKFVITNTYAPPPVEEIPEEEVPLTPAPSTSEPEMEELFDEEIPLAGVPMTGDASALWLVLSTLSGTGLAGVTFLGRKKRED